MILSSQQYSGGGLWPKRVELTSAFEEKRLADKIEGAFAPTDWHSVVEQPASDANADAVADSASNSADILPNTPEDDVAVIPLEEATLNMISISEEELEATINRSRLEGESIAKQRLEDLYESKIQATKDEQKAFFEALDKNLNTSSEFTSQLSKLALALGEIIARSELTNNREVIESFLSAVINRVAEENEVSATFSIAEEWRDLITTLDMESIYPNYRFDFDRTLKPGSVSVVFGNGGFEDSIDQRIAELSQQILNYVPSGNRPLQRSNPSNDFVSQSVDAENTIAEESAPLITQTGPDAGAITTSFSVIDKDENAGAIDPTDNQTPEPDPDE